MNSEKLNDLRIDPAAKRRPSTALWFIFAFVFIATALAATFALKTRNNERRIMNGNKSAPSAAMPAGSALSTNRPISTGATSSSSNTLFTVSGYIVNRERIELSPRFIGVVKWIGVKKGDPVTNGQVVVLLDDSEQQARIAEVSGRLTNAMVAIDKAQLDYDRILQLTKTAIETRQAEDDARLRLASARATLKEVQGAYDVTRTYLDWTVIRSPIDGVVLEKLVDPAELVVPQSFGGGRGPSTALLAVANPKDLQVEVDLNEAFVAKVFLNQKCRVSPEAYPDKAYDGYVAEMAPEANRQKGTLQVKVQIRNPDRFLTPELSAKVDFLGTEDKLSR